MVHRSQPPRRRQRAGEGGRRGPRRSEAGECDEGRIGQGADAVRRHGRAASLLDAPPAPGTIVKTATKDAVGITEWELSNGVKVVLKPTTFKQDEILFRATSPGGTSLASDQDYIPASTATQVVVAGGLGKFSALDLRKVLTGKIASATPFIGELEEG